MKYNPETEEFTLNSGKNIYANIGILGISAISKDKDLFQGYDSLIYHADEEEEDRCLKLSLEERREIADYMINLWKEWAS